MVSSGMLRRVALVRTDVSQELSASFIRVTRIGEQRASVASDSAVPSTCHPDDGGAKFLRNVSTYRTHTAKHPRRHHSS
jgi:hypothetical protein